MSRSVASPEAAVQIGFEAVPVVPVARVVVVVETEAFPTFVVAVPFRLEGYHAYQGVACNPYVTCEVDHSGPVLASGQVVLAAEMEVAVVAVVVVVVVVVVLVVVALMVVVSGLAV